jgi:hypothetical protein
MSSIRGLGRIFYTAHHSALPVKAPQTKKIQKKFKKLNH